MSAKGTFSLALILIASLGVFSGVQAASFPRFTSEPQDVLVPQDTSFRVVLLCSPQPYTKVVDVRWQFGVQSVENIPGLSTSRNGSGWMLTIDYQQGSRIPLVGNYACVADYKRLGNLRSRVAWVRQFGPANFQVLGPEFPTLRVAEDNAALLRCNVDLARPYRGYAGIETKVAWFRGTDATGHTRLEEGGRHRVRILPSGSLLLPMTSLLDTDYYFCNAEVAFKGRYLTATSEQVFLLVEKNVKNTTCLPQPYNGRCTNSDLYFFNSQTFRCMGYQQGQCKEQNSHNYFRDIHVCRAACMVSSGLSDTKVQTQTSLITAFVGQDINLDCSATGLPTPQIYWQKDYNIPNIQPDIGGSLTLRSATTSDSGLYTCHVHNSGRYKPVITIVVNPLARSFFLSDSEVTIMRYEWRRLTCSADDFLPQSVIAAAPRCKFEWLLGQRPAPYALIDHGKFHSTINITGDEFGILQCRVSRILTGEEHQGSIFVTPKPSPPHDVRTVSTDHTSAVVSWRLRPNRPKAGYRRVDISWRKNSNAGPQDTQKRQLVADFYNQVMLSGLEPDTTYIVKLELIGLFARSDAVEKMIHTARIKPNAPRQVAVDVINASAARVTWDEPLARQPAVAIDGYILQYWDLSATTPPMIVQPSLTRDITITGLRPLTQYAWVVKAYSVSPDYIGDASETVHTTTPWGNLRPRILNSTTISATWATFPPEWKVASQVLYIANTSPKGNESSQWTAVKPFSLSNRIFSLVASDLIGNRSYVLKLFLHDANGKLLNETRSGMLRTPPTAPAPISLSAVPISPREIQLFWQFPVVVDPSVGRIVKVQYQIPTLPWTSMNYTDYRNSFRVRGLAVERPYTFLVRCVTEISGVGPARSVKASTSRYCDPPLIEPVRERTANSLTFGWYHEVRRDFCTPEFFNVRLYLENSPPAKNTTLVRSMRVPGRERGVRFSNLLQGYTYRVEVDASRSTETRRYVSSSANITDRTAIEVDVPAPSHVSVHYSRSDGIPEIRWWQPEPLANLVPHFAKVFMWNPNSSRVVTSTTSIDLSRNTTQKHFSFKPFTLPGQVWLFDMAVFYAQDGSDIIYTNGSMKGQSALRTPREYITSAVRIVRRNTNLGYKTSKRTEPMILHGRLPTCCQAGVGGARPTNKLLSPPLHVTVRADKGTLAVEWHAPHHVQDDLKGYYIYFWEANGQQNAMPMVKQVHGDSRRVLASVKLGMVFGVRVTANGTNGQSSPSHTVFGMVRLQRVGPSLETTSGKNPDTSAATPSPGPGATKSSGGSAVLAAVVACIVTAIIVLLVFALIALYRRRTQHHQFSDTNQNLKEKAVHSQAPSPILWSPDPSAVLQANFTDDNRLPSKKDGVLNHVALARGHRSGSSSGVSSNGDSSDSDQDPQQPKGRWRRSNSLPFVVLGNAGNSQVKQRPMGISRDDSNLGHGVGKQPKRSAAVKRSHSMNNKNSTYIPKLSPPPSPPPHPPSNDIENAGHNGAVREFNSFPTRQATISTSREGAAEGATCHSPKLERSRTPHEEGKRSPRATAYNDYDDPEEVVKSCDTVIPPKSVTPNGQTALKLPRRDQLSSIRVSDCDAKGRSNSDPISPYSTVVAGIIPIGGSDYHDYAGSKGAHAEGGGEHHRQQPDRNQARKTCPRFDPDQATGGKGVASPYSQTSVLVGIGPVGPGTGVGRRPRAQSLGDTQRVKFVPPSAHYASIRIAEEESGSAPNVVFPDSTPPPAGYEDIDKIRESLTTGHHHRKLTQSVSADPAGPEYANSLLKPEEHVYAVVNNEAKRNPAMHYAAVSTGMAKSATAGTVAPGADQTVYATLMPNTASSRHNSNSTGSNR